jgi:hypothetical protein
VTSFSLVRWLCGYFFGILVCLTQPHSRGSLRVDPGNPTGPLIVGRFSYIADVAVECPFTD